MAFSLDVANLTAWYLPDDDEMVQQNPARPHMTDKKVSQKQLATLGVLAAEVKQPEAWNEDSNLQEIRKDRGYHAYDSVDCSNLSDDTKVKFFTEHLHVDEEIRLITNGIGYFDIRDPEDKWIRIRIGTGALIILPPGIWHRFCVSEEDGCLQAVRLFTNEPKWTAYPRDGNSLEGIAFNGPSWRGFALGSSAHRSHSVNRRS
ncbi:1,2-dihydroxy-3-keto-5-methylthiopentene dioxygenase, variant 2 [Perkinsus olseni]|uniref:Acireductone dioxygenase n=1 Tax=Perkinsus olseni TaxID=32597 RepID=A0A7J6N8T8_PEROL|nr:1,2-dihydroxy-3-keto-5-methylthiopentene dioxygenase, variant 2 [Perkinsus olseni]